MFGWVTNDELEFLSMVELIYDLLSEGFELRRRRLSGFQQLATPHLGLYMYKFILILLICFKVVKASLTHNGQYVCYKCFRSKIYV